MAKSLSACKDKAQHIETDLGLSRKRTVDKWVATVDVNIKALLH